MTPSNAGQLDLLPTEAAELLARARRRSDLRDAAEPRVDYKALNQMVRRQRAALTRAMNSGDPEQVVLACRDALREWNTPGSTWPDDWASWQCALDDVLPAQPAGLARGSGRLALALSSRSLTGGKSAGGKSRNETTGMRDEEVPSGRELAVGSAKGLTRGTPSLSRGKRTSKARAAEGRVP